MSDEPDFRDLVGDDLAPEEEARLRSVHDLLVTAGPPPELPPELAAGPPAPQRGVVVGLPRRRVGAAVVLAAALAAAAFGGGYLVGHQGSDFESVATPIQMRGSSPAQLASISLGSVDAAGNWPLLLRVRGLKPLPAGGYYELYLADGDKLGPSCGTFRVEAEVTEVYLNAPYKLKRWKDWVVVAHLPGKKAESPPILRTT